MLSFHERYRPLTSRPYLSSDTYAEYQACEALRPYIVCYWSTREAETIEQVGRSEIIRVPDISTEEKGVLVVPDTCMDIIVRVNHTKQMITSILSGMQDAPFISAQIGGGDYITCFAVRFHFWAAHLFLQINFRDISNQSIALGAISREWEKLFEPFLYITELKDRLEHVENFLLSRIEQIEINNNLFNAVKKMLAVPGRAGVNEICADSCISQRQMERLALQHVGLPLKRICNLVRYQNVWHDVVSSNTFNIQDAVFRYGYTDQAHLLKEFKRFHGVTLTQGRRIAELNR